MKVLVTGANGFVGQNLSNQLEAGGHDVIRAVRKKTDSQETSVGNIGADTDWLDKLYDVECVIHCAARVHVMKEMHAEALAAYRSVNLDGTRRLAEQAAQSGVRRFIYLSTIKVNGEQTELAKPFSVSDAVAPVDSYAISKWEAEQALFEISRSTGLEVVILRPPLVYGPGVKGNFFSLVSLISKGIPLPLGAIDNKRSLVGLDNLLDLIIRCINHPAAVGQVFLVSDGQDLSTPELISYLAESMGKKIWLIPVPKTYLLLLGKMTGRLSQVQRLVGSLQVDITKTCELLDWTPPLSVSEGLHRAVVNENTLHQHIK